MNTTLITTRSTIRATALAACLVLLVAGATACGTEDGTASAKTGNRAAALSSIDLIESAKGNQSTYLQQLRAEAEAARQARADHAYAARSSQGHTGDTANSQGFGDDRRQAIEGSQPRHTPPMHDSGYNKAP